MATATLPIEQLEIAPAHELLQWAISTFGRDFAISTSFQAEGMVLVDMAAKIDPSVRVFTLDTGRLPEESSHMIEMVRDRYGINVEVVYPDHRELERMTTLHGINLFYRDPSLRKLCCQIRKVRPMERKLTELRAYTVGLRRGQSSERSATAKVMEVDGRLKLSPLADWTARQIDRYIGKNDVPIHPLYSRGYPSIGCDPCTRAISPGEPERAGRWWWEDEDAKECGLHVTPSGRVQRSLDVLLEDILGN